MAANSSTTSKSYSAVRYLQIYSSWLKNDRDRNWHSTIPVEVILVKMFLLTKAEYHMVYKLETDEKKLKHLFIDILPSKEEQGFDQLVKILFEIRCDELANDLLKEKDNFSTTDYPKESTENLIPNEEICLRNQTSSLQNLQMKGAQAHLSRFIKEYVDFMAKYWSDVIPVAQTEAAFVQVQVFEYFKAANGNPVNSYREVFDKGENEIHQRILIQADPGCGKTTYVNKLALDWAQEDEYLREKFDFVFLIPLQTTGRDWRNNGWTRDWRNELDGLNAIKWFLPKDSEQFFESYAQLPDSKILLIFDGFDERSVERYSSVMNILNGQSKRFQFLHVIVTTRRSHVDKIPQQFRGRSLLIEGFHQQSMKQFLDKRHVPLPSVGQQSNLSHLLLTPLFCTIYYLLHFGRGGPIELEDSYDLLKALVENSVTNTLKKKTVANEKEQLDEIGKFAFQMLDSDSLNFVEMFCRSSEAIKSCKGSHLFHEPKYIRSILIDFSRVNLDLLIKRRIPTPDVGCFEEEFSLPHHLIAEYLAARYFARSLTEEQLKQARASVLLPFEAHRVLDLPFVRFFLFELLFLYLEKKYDERVFDNFLNIPQLRFISSCKLKKDFATLDNVSELDFDGWNRELVNHSRFIPTLSNCRHLSSLRLWSCGLLKIQVEQLIKLFNDDCFQKLIELDLGLDENVGSTPQLFTALGECKHLRLLHVYKCEMTVESVNELARCIDNNGLADLSNLYLSYNENVGSSTDLFHVLHKCPELQMLNLQSCSITQESLNIFLSTFNSNTFQQLGYIWLTGNRDIKADDNFFIALEKCWKISGCFLSKSEESDLSEVGRRAKDTLKERRCRF